MVDGVAKRLAAAVKNISKLSDADLEAAADAAEQDDSGDNQVGGCGPQIWGGCGPQICCIKMPACGWAGQTGCRCHVASGCASSAAYCAKLASAC